MQKNPQLYDFSLRIASKAQCENMLTYLRSACIAVIRQHVLRVQHGDIRRRVFGFEQVLVRESLRLFCLRHEDDQEDQILRVRLEARL